MCSASTDEMIDDRHRDVADDKSSSSRMVRRELYKVEWLDAVDDDGCMIMFICLGSAMRRMMMERRRNIIYVRARRNSLSSMIMNVKRLRARCEAIELITFSDGLVYSRVIRMNESTRFPQRRSARK